MLDVLNASFGYIKTIPDPNNILIANQWYLANHISSPLVFFNHQQGIFNPLIAEKWTISGNVYTFYLRKDAKFHDGSPIRATDVEATIKNILKAKTVTHFPLWEFLVGCDRITSINDNCDGVQTIDDHTIKFTLKSRNESFFLALSSPETGVWSKDDIAVFSEKGINPTKFSGPYWVSKLDESYFILSRNEHSLLIKENPSAPKTIKSPIINRQMIEQAFYEKKLDAFFGDYTPFNEFDWEKLDVNVHYTTPSSLIYLQKNKNQLNRAKIGSDVLQAIWNQSNNPQVIPAKSFLPPGSLGLCSESEILNAIPPQSSQKTIRIAILDKYYKDGLHDLIKKAANSVGIDVVTEKISAADWYKLMDGTHENDRWDYTLSSYTASERYPAVQLRFLLGGKKGPDEDLFSIDDPNNSESRIKSIKNFETWMVKNHYVIPLFFVRTQIVYQKNIDVGDQPTTDADIQYWKVKRKVDE